MSVIKWLDNFISLQNLLGIYWNYCTQEKKTKCFMCFKLLLQTVLFTLIIHFKLYYLLRRGSEQVNIIYCALSISAYINAMLSILIGICHSRNFQSYYISINRVSDWFKDDIKLTKSVKKVYWLTIIITLLLMVFVIIRSLQVLEKFSESFIIIFAVQMIIRFIIIHQQVMLVFVIMIVVCMFKRLISLVSAAQKRVESCNISSDVQCDVIMEQIHKWVDLYRDLANCCEKVTLCFGRQFLFTLISSTSYSVFFMYEMFSTIATKPGDTNGFKKTGLNIICIYLLLILIPIAATQLARNQGVKFHRLLARLYNTRIIDFHKSEMKSIKDFIRLIKKSPIEIKILPKIPAGMYMLPVLLSLIVNYIIVLLQFNHII